MERIAVIGTSSSGKTTLASSLAKKMNIEHQELDFFFWEPGWRQATNDDFRNRVDQFTQKTKWIIDGNFSQVRDLVWGRATHVIWLDYPFHVIIWRFFKRAITRSVRRTELWNGNRENLWNNIFAPHSLLIWILKTYWRNKKRFSFLMNSREYSHLKFIRLTSPEETARFLHAVTILLND